MHGVVLFCYYHCDFQFPVFSVDCHVVYWKTLNSQGVFLAKMLAVLKKFIFSGCFSSAAAVKHDLLTLTRVK